MLKWRVLFGICWLLAAAALVALWQWGDPNVLSVDDVIESADRILSWFGGEIAKYMTGSNPAHVREFISAKIGVISFAISLVALAIFIAIVILRLIFSGRQPISPAIVAVMTLLISKGIIALSWIVFTDLMVKYYAWHADIVKDFLRQHGWQKSQVILVTGFKIHHAVVALEAIIAAIILIGLVRLAFGTWRDRRKQHRDTSP